MSITTINPGDVFVGNDRASFATIEVLRKCPFSYSPMWECKSTNKYGASILNRVYDSTLKGGRYTLQISRSTASFNGTASPAYRRPFGVDIPNEPTAPIREAGAYSFISKNTSTLIYIDGGVVRQAKGKDAKKRLLLDNDGGIMLLAVPGKYSMDTFYIDDRAKALAVLGLVPVAQATPIKAADGSEWVAA